MASIRKRGKSWQVRWWQVEEDGVRRKRSKNCKTLRNAEALKRKVEHSIDLYGRYIPPEHQPAAVRPEPELQELIEAFLTGQKRAGRADNTILSNGARLGLFSRWMADQFPGEKLVGDMFSQSLITDYYDWTGEGKGRNGKQRKAATRRKLVETVLTFWGWLSSRDDYREFVSARVPQLRHLDVAPATRTRKVAPTWAELDAAIACAMGTWLYELLVVLRFTGLRVQQAMELQMTDLDLQRAVLHVRPELGKTEQEKAGRWIPISQHLVDIIRSWGPREGYLVHKVLLRNTGKEPSRTARSRDTRAIWDEAIALYDVRPEAVGQPHHCFRAGYRSELKRAGADEESVEATLGHSLGISDHYQDLAMLPMREAVALIPPIATPTRKQQVVRDKLGVPVGPLTLIHSR